jgi:hypothetical protein
VDGCVAVVHGDAARFVLQFRPDGDLRGAVPVLKGVFGFHHRSVSLRVNFSTLGYGDIVMSKHWRMLGPIEAANGILMFGVSTSVMTAAVMAVIKYHGARLRQE